MSIVGRYTTEETAIAVDMWAKGATRKEIAVSIQRSEGSVSNFISVHRDKFPPRDSFGHAAKYKILSAFNKHRNVYDTAIELNWTQKTVRRWLMLLIKEGDVDNIGNDAFSITHYNTDPQLSPLAKCIAKRLYMYKARDVRRGMQETFALDAWWVERQLQKQNYKCYYTDSNLSMSPKSKKYITIDRVDSSKGYTQDNCVICCNAINSAKNSMSLDKFILMCHAVARKYPIELNGVSP